MMLNMFVSITSENPVTFVLVLVQLILALYTNNEIVAASSSAAAPVSAGPEAESVKNQVCLPSSCGSISNISYPFRLKGHDPPHCGDPRFELCCEDNRTTFYLYSLKFYVLNISYNPYFPSIQLVDANLDTNIPLYPIQSPCNYYADYYSLSLHSLLNCTKPAPNSASKYMDASACIDIYDNNNNSASSSSSPAVSSSYYLYVLPSYSSLSDIHESCSLIASVPAGSYNITNKTIVDICRFLLLGFAYPSIKSEPCRPLTLTRRYV